MEGGAALELATSLAPHAFLPLACTANLAKNLAAVTASATRAPIYRTFARANNLADITAKGVCFAVLLWFGVGQRAPPEHGEGLGASCTQPHGPGGKRGTKHALLAAPDSTAGLGIVKIPPPAAATLHPKHPRRRERRQPGRHRGHGVWHRAGPRRRARGPRVCGSVGGIPVRLAARGRLGGAALPEQGAPGIRRAALHPHRCATCMRGRVPCFFVWGLFRFGGGGEGDA